MPSSGLLKPSLLVKVMLVQAPAFTENAVVGPNTGVKVAGFVLMVTDAERPLTEPVTGTPAEVTVDLTYTVSVPAAVETAPSPELQSVSLYAVKPLSCEKTKGPSMGLLNWSKLVKVSAVQAPAATVIALPCEIATVAVLGLVLMVALVEMVPKLAVARFPVTVTPAVLALVDLKYTVSPPAEVVAVV